VKPLAHYIETKGISLEQLVEASALDAKVVQAIVSGNYTPSPAERTRLAAALDVPVEEISWGHTVPVEHLWGHGPQFGRNP
jgi:ribosome-binding protein aMBF1 (putative translation factor)